MEVEVPVLESEESEDNEEREEPEGVRCIAGLGEEGTGKRTGGGESEGKERCTFGVLSR